MYMHTCVHIYIYIYTCIYTHVCMYVTMYNYVWPLAPSARASPKSMVASVDTSHNPYEFTRNGLGIGWLDGIYYSHGLGRFVGIY